MTHQEFVDAINKSLAANPRYASKPESIQDVVTLLPGKKYTKVVIANKSGEHRSVFCFLDNDGNVYKAASWKAPAKGVRFTLDQITQEHIEAITREGYPSTSILYRS